MSLTLGHRAAGNMTGDGLYSYTYNAENEQTSAAGVTYTCDGNGKRVKRFPEHSIGKAHGTMSVGFRPGL
jgi:hypothetical protein